MRAPRSVTLQPMGRFSRSLNDAIDLLRLGDQRLLAGDLRQIAGSRVHDLLVGDGFAHAHVHRDLGDLRDLHDVLEPEALSVSFGTTVLR
jgi:hypothetical protein